MSTKMQLNLGVYISLDYIYGNLYTTTQRTSTPMSCTSNHNNPQDYVSPVVVQVLLSVLQKGEVAQVTSS